MFKIGEFSRLSGTSSRMLRHYEKVGLIQPAKIELETGYRFYQAEQLQTVNRIKYLQSLGLSLALIQEIFTKQDSGRLKEYLRIREKEVQEELAAVQAQQNMLETIQATMSEAILDYPVVLKEIPPRQVISVRKIITTAMDEGQLWQELFEEAQRQKVRLAEPPLGVSIYHDPEYKEEDIDLELQSSVVGDYQDTETITFYQAPAVQVASVTFSGSYEQMPAVMAALGRWIEANSYEIDGPMFNINHVSPAQDPDPENWLTEACLAVKKASKGAESHG